MKHTTALIRIMLVFAMTKVGAQGVVIPKDTIYLNYSFYVEKCQHRDIISRLKWNKEEGTQFNLCGKAVFLFPNKGVSDTLNLKQLKDYPVTRVEDIDSLMSDWQERAKPLLIKKYGIPYPNTTNKNNMFVTYIIEKYNDCIIKYRVYWRKQGI